MKVNASSDAVVAPKLRYPVWSTGGAGVLNSHCSDTPRFAKPEEQLAGIKMLVLHQVGLCQRLLCLA